MSNIKSVNYRVVQNAAASKLANKEVYTALVNIKESWDLENITERMVAEGCLASTSAIELVIKDFAKLVSKLVAEGRSVNIAGLVRFAPSIRGTFETPDATWNAANNQVVVNANTGAQLRLAAMGSSLQRVDKVVVPVLEVLRDMATGRANIITSNGTFLVTGSLLTWDASAADEGWFISNSGVETKCETVESEQDPDCAVLRTPDMYSVAGQPLELFFRTRINGLLRQMKYDGEIVTATAE